MKSLISSFSLYRLPLVTFFLLLSDSDASFICRWIQVGRRSRKSSAENCADGNIRLGFLSEFIFIHLIRRNKPSGHRPAAAQGAGHCPGLVRWIEGKRNCVNRPFFVSFLSFCFAFAFVGHCWCLAFFLPSSAKQEKSWTRFLQSRTITSCNLTAVVCGSVRSCGSSSPCPFFPLRYVWRYFKISSEKKTPLLITSSHSRKSRTFNLFISIGIFHHPNRAADGRKREDRKQKLCGRRRSPDDNDDAAVFFSVQRLIHFNGMAAPASGTVSAVNLSLLYSADGHFWLFRFNGIFLHFDSGARGGAQHSRCDHENFFIWKEDVQRQDVEEEFLKWPPFFFLPRCFTGWPFFFSEQPVDVLETSRRLLHEAAEVA